MITPKNEPLIELSGVERIYGHGHAAMYALKGIDFSVRKGEFVAIMGASGSGKSTCLNILGCLDTPTKGIYRFQGVDVGGLTQDQRAMLRRMYLGFIFQGYNLLDRTSALENVELPLIYRGFPASKRRSMARNALDLVGLTGWENNRPSELSGGQQQRVAIARAIVTDPDLLLADEPTGNLDSERSLEIIQLLFKINQDKNKTIIMVTHEPEMAGFAQRIVTFRDGLVVEDVRNGKAME